MKNISGMRFGRLVAISPTDLRHDHKVVWKCICDCGNETFVVSRSLIVGTTKSCGCLRKEILQRGNTKLNYGISAFNQLYGSYKRQAEIRGKEFNLSREEFFNLTKSNCYYCGVIPKQCQRGKNLNGEYIFNGVDRVNNDIGYNVENCVACCGKCNKAKDTMTKEEFKIWINNIYREFILNNK